MIRFLQVGQPPKTLPCSFDMTAGDAFAIGGGGSRQDKHSLSVNGKPATGDTLVKAGDTVAYQPDPGNG